MSELEVEKFIQVHQCAGDATMYDITTKSDKENEILEIRMDRSVLDRGWSDSVKGTPVLKLMDSGDDATLIFDSKKITLSYSEMAELKGMLKLYDESQIKAGHVICDDINSFKQVD